MPTEELRLNVAKHMAYAHITVTDYSAKFLERARRNNYVTPKSFLELIAFYKHLLSEKRGVVAHQIERLDVGLSTLRKTQADVAELQVDLQHTMVKVQEKVEATEKLLVEIGEQRGAAEEQKAFAAKEEEKASEASAKAAAIQEQAEGELSEAKPAMERAKSAVDCLNKASLTELKNFSKPPSGVELVTGAVIMMLEGDFKNYLKWDRAKKMMGKVDAFLQSLKDYKAEAMTEELIKKLGPLVENPDFNAEAMTKKSEAAANLCSWVVNIYTYNRIWVKVKPLMDALEEATQNKAAAEAQLAEVQAQVAEVEAALQALEDKLMAATNEKLEVEAEAKRCTERLDLAERLVNGLASENTRWGQEIERLKANEVTLIGDVLLASAFVSYVGAFDHVFRNELWREVWIPDIGERAIPLSEGVDPLNLLTDDARTAAMLNEGLPADRISIENGSIINASKRWPLMIDPQLQGIKWLKQKEEGDNLKVITLTQPKWLNVIVNAIQQGQTVIIENVGEDIDATLDPVLARAVYRKGRTIYLRVGGEEVEFDPKFKLYLQSKLFNPHYKPEIQAQCTLINFIATEKGLEDQLLARVVNAEKKELEERKQALQAAFNRYKIELLELENQLLERLANAPDDILSDVPLIEGLEATKKAATEINEAVKKGKVTEQEINKAREKYIPVASEGAMLYFMITQLSAIDHMYQYSLDSFVLYFYKAIRTAPKDEDVEKRVASLRDTLRLTIYTWVSRGLFEAHKLILLSQLTFLLMRRGSLAEEFDADLFSFLMRGPKKLGESNPLDWLPDPAWNSVQALAEIDDFAKLPSDLVEAPARFKEWFIHVTPETEKLPLDWAQLDKTPFKKLLVLRCLRPDRMTVAMNSWVGATLPSGMEYVNCDSTLSSLQVLEATYRDSMPETPIYFILSPGADVVSDMDKLALKHGMEKGVSYHNISMGQGQDIVAEQKLQAAHKQGHWVILNNVHLMPRWLVELEKMMDAFAAEGSHERFRVFLTSEPANSIPIGVLNRSIKLTNEPPTGLKANLKRAFCSFSQEYIDELETKQRSILFGLCHFHAILLERKKFGPKGFNMMYPFGIGDLRDSAVCLSNYMENAGSKIPWEDLRYIFGQIMYGGHIVNDFDRLLCMTYLTFYLRDELLDEMELFPFVDDEKAASFKTPSPTTYEAYIEHIDRELKGDTPLAFGLHPNAEIGFRTAQSENLFRTLEELQPRDGAGAEEGSSPQQVAENKLTEILDAFGEINYDLEEIATAMDEKGPFQNVLLLECEQMGRLLTHLKRTLNDLQLGFAGELTMSDAMDALMSCLFMDRVPADWAKLAWPSLRPLKGWLYNLQLRVNQLGEWVGNPMEPPRVTWLSGLINPQSFLTAISQQTAQRNSLELDKLVIQTEITKRAVEEVEGASRDGCFVTGLYLDGARWDTSSGQLQNSKPREMFFPMPVINCRAIAAEKLETKGYYMCPVYKTEQRGPTYVFQAQLKSKSAADRWILAGVALIMDLVEV
jgi:dynein heavy chain